MSNRNLTMEEDKKIEWLFEGKWAGLSLVRILTSFLSTSETGISEEKRNSCHTAGTLMRSENSLTINPF